jgi:hypothetical protein
MTDNVRSTDSTDRTADPETVLGTTTYEDVLFTADTETPVNVLTGEPPARSQVSVEEAKAFAEELAGDTPYIALPSSVETQVETNGPPYTAGVFYHFKAVGTLERHRAYHAAVDSESFDVEFDADYESDDLTITVARTD